MPQFPEHALAAPSSTVRLAGLPLALGVAALTIGSAVAAGMAPIGFSIAIVFLLAGPHNWLEARYILRRLPARTGKLRGFFLASVGGVLGLTTAFAAIPWLITDDPVAVGLVYATWNTLFLFWTAGLVWMRSRTNPRFDAGWVWPLVFALTSVVWLEPALLNLALVYLHPLLALGLLDRELARSRRPWLPAYRFALLGVPAALLFLFAYLHDTPNLPGDDPLTAAITAHSDAWFLRGISTHFLVAAHTFLESVHYGVWVVLIPLVGLRSAPWRLDDIPAANRGQAWANVIAAILAIGLAVVIALWFAFSLDYTMTRTVYFTVAMLHVLGEIPFLLRML